MTTPPTHRCKSGDMTGKHGQLTIASFGDNNRPTYSFIDSNLELGGAYSSELTLHMYTHSLSHTCRGVATVKATEALAS